MYETAFSFPGRNFVVAFSGPGASFGSCFSSVELQHVGPREHTRKAGYGITNDVAAISWGLIPQF